jgi:hypothetical protein
LFGVICLGLFVWGYLFGIGEFVVYGLWFLVSRLVFVVWGRETFNYWGKILFLLTQGFKVLGVRKPIRSLCKGWYLVKCLKDLIGFQ